MKKILFLAVLGLILSNAPIANADISVKYPGTFTLGLNETATVTNYQSMRIKFENIVLDSLEAYPNNKGRVQIIVTGGSQQTFTIPENGSVEAEGLKITVNSIGGTSATFAIALSGTSTTSDCPPGTTPVMLQTYPPQVKCVAESATPPTTTNTTITGGGSVTGGTSSGSTSSGGTAPGSTITNTSAAVEVLNLSEDESVVSSEKVEATGETSTTYEVTTKQRKWLLFVIPLTAETTYSVDASTGVVVDVDSPWWSFLAW